MLKATLTAALSIALLCQCTQHTNEPVKIGINPWPGYEFLHLAKQQGFYQDAELNIELVPFNSLSDAQRAYINGRVDGLASTMIEAVQSQVLSNKPLEIILVPDYSNGGDVVLAKAPIDSIANLKGKRVGCEISSLGIYMLHRALNSAQLSLSDIELVNVEQSAAERAFRENKIDAFVTYPPISIDLLKIDKMTTIFTSAEIPYDIIDTVAVSTAALNKNPKFVEKLHGVWQRTLDYAQTYPDEAYELMANRQGISKKEFTDTLLDIQVLNTQEQHKLFADSQSLQEKALDVCTVLVDVQAIEQDCRALPNMIYQRQR